MLDLLVDVRYGAFVALKKISLRVKKGEMVSILGNNGAGKTTLLKTITGHLNENQIKGFLVFNKKNILGSTPRDLIIKGISFVPESKEIFSNLSVLDNLFLGSYVFYFDRKKRARNFDFVYHLFPLLYDKKNQLAGNLSGGQQQILAIGRALMTSPKLLILDEPMTGLSPKFQKMIERIIQQLLREGLGILLVEQDYFNLLNWTHHIYIFQNGSLVFCKQSALNKKEKIKIKEGILNGFEENFFLKK